MNKAFKVLWNDHRRTYVVSSEETASRGKRAKSKTKIAAAVAATALAFGMAGAADARIALPSDGLIDHEWVLQNGSSKLIFANGEKEIIIAGNPKGENGATPVNAKQFIKDLHEAVRSKDLGKIREVLAAGKDAGAVVTVTGGGNLVFDSVTDGGLNLSSRPDVATTPSGLFVHTPWRISRREVCISVDVPLPALLG